MTRRRALMAQVESSGRLPAEYQEVEYLESTGTQYIDTGIHTDPDIGIFAKLYTISTGNKSWFGSNNNTYASLILNAYSPTEIEYQYGNDYWGRKTFANAVNSILEIHFTTDQQLIINDTVVVSNLRRITGRSSGSIHLFVRSGGSAFVVGRAYTFKIYYGAAKVLDLIPCYRKMDSKPGMYDLVSGTFFTNQGTGEFTVGADVN